VKQKMRIIPIIAKGKIALGNDFKVLMDLVIV
jgi:hypothetical protein